MKPFSISRRSFLNTAALASLVAAPAVVLAIEPFQRKGKPRLWSSLAAYSFRDYMKFVNHKRDAKTDTSKYIDLFQFVDFCAENGCAGTELTAYYFPPNVTNDYLIKLKRHAFLRGVAVSGSAIGNTFTHPPGPAREAEMVSAKQWIDHASVLGAPHIRVFAGNAYGSKEDSTRRCIEALEEACDYAGKKGIFLGLENHGGIVAEADALLEIVQAVKSPWIGINLDTGNFHTDDPYKDLERIAPFAVNVQFKVEIQRRGQKAERADFGRFVRILKEVNYQGFVALEYEAKEDPWIAVPRLMKELNEHLHA